MTLASHVTFAGMFEQRGDDDSINQVEIPVFQRDYAQGRKTSVVSDIRANFLDVLRSAIGGDQPEPVGLDFVYGEVESGTLRPLDGQQRLTTLFLLHWYLASRTDGLAGSHPWERFSYATRPSARLFCERLVTSALPDVAVPPSTWICDQPWYLFVWRHDPTIQAMLVMLDDIAEQFRSVDATAAWARLTDAENPAVSFLLLSLPDMGSAEDLYIKMNSRGKPLTEFETFKAQFEKTIEKSERAAEFALKVDTDWSDLLWGLRGDDDLVDDEFLRYIEFVTEICEWRDGRTDGGRGRLRDRASRVFGDDNPNRQQHLDFLFQTFDTWKGCSITQTFESMFTGDVVSTSSDPKVRLFFRSDASPEERLNLFNLCCRSYGESRGRARVFSLGQSLMLYAVLIHLTEDTPDFQRRVRVLRNLIEASSGEMRQDRMPKILDDVHAVIRSGAVEKVTTLNTAQVEDEKRKAQLLTANPELQDAVFALEDHALLRGSLGALDLNPATLPTRAATFQTLMSDPDLWTHLMGALLAVGEYQRRRKNSRPFLFGTNSKNHENAWRELLTGATYERLQPTREVLVKLLDAVASSETDSVEDALGEITDGYLTAQESKGAFDWRYYMAKYPIMRDNGSSTYFAERFDGAEEAAMGYSLCVLRAGRAALNSRYRDPYLLALWHELSRDERIEDPWFTGYEENPRWLHLNRSGAALRCVPDGYELAPPVEEGQLAAFHSVCEEVGADGRNVVAVPPREVEGQGIDAEDRVLFGAGLVRRLLDAGL